MQNPNGYNWKFDSCSIFEPQSFPYGFSQVEIKRLKVCDYARLWRADAYLRWLFRNNLLRRRRFLFRPGVTVSVTSMFWGLLLAFGALIVIVPLLVSGKVSRKSHVPFGPFLIVAIFIAWLFGQHLIDWYGSVILIG